MGKVCQTRLGSDAWPVLKSDNGNVQWSKLTMCYVEERKQSEEFGNSWIGRTRKFILNLTEYPETSVGARVREYNWSFKVQNWREHY